MLNKAKLAFNTYTQATEEAVSTFEQWVEANQASAQNIRKKALRFAKRNVFSAFDFVQKLVQAKDIDELIGLQSEFLQSQMQVLGEQVKELGEAATVSVTESVKGLGESATCCWRDFNRTPSLAPTADVPAAAGGEPKSNCLRSRYRGSAHLPSGGPSDDTYLGRFPRSAIIPSPPGSPMTLGNMRSLGKPRSEKPADRR